jgi:hypothetical protein
VLLRKVEEIELVDHRGVNSVMRRDDTHEEVYGGTVIFYE